MRAAAVLLIGWAAYNQLYGHRHRVRVGMTAGFGGLLLWSFLMATAHGAGLMLLPAIMPLCLAASPMPDVGAPARWASRSRRSASIPARCWP